MKCNPYHSIRPGDPQVYHDHRDCVDGNNIEDRYRREGTDNRRRCDRCVGMDKK